MVQETKQKLLEYQAKITASPSDELVKIIDRLKNDKSDGDKLIESLNQKIMDLRKQLTQNAKVEYQNIMKSEQTKIEQDEKVVQPTPEKLVDRKQQQQQHKNKYSKFLELKEEHSKLSTKCEILKDHKWRLHILSESRHKEIDKLKHKLAVVNRELGDLKKNKNSIQNSNNNNSEHRSATSLDRDGSRRFHKITT